MFVDIPSSVVCVEKYFNNLLSKLIEMLLIEVITTRWLQLAIQT